MRVLIRSFSARGASVADGDGRILVGRDCREIVHAMRELAPFAGCSDIEAYMRWTLRALKTPGADAAGIEGATPQARAESFLALLGEMGLAGFLPDLPVSSQDRTPCCKGPIPVPEDVLAGIESVRRSGRTNMLDYLVVIRLARVTGEGVAADWIARHVPLYCAGVFRGFVAATPGKDA